MTRRLRSNLGWTALSAATSQGALFFSNVVFARILGGEELADYLVILTLTAMVPAMFSLGMERIGVIILANVSERGVRSARLAILKLSIVASVLAGISAVLVVLVGPFLTADDDATPWIVGAIVFAENFRIMLADLPRSRGRADIAMFAGPAIPRLALFLGVLVLHFVFHAEVALNILLLLLLASTVFSCVVALLWALSLRSFVSPKSSGKRDPVDSTSFGDVVRAGAPMSVANVALVVLGQADTLIVAAFFDASIVGSFALMARTSNLLGNVKTMLNVALMPILAQRPRDEQVRDQQLALVRLVVTCLFVAALPVCVVVAFWPSEIFSWVFGDASVSASGAAVWLLLGQLVSVGAGLAGTILLRDGAQVLLMWIQVGSAVLTTVAMLFSAMSGDVVLVGLTSGLGTAACAVVMAAFAYSRDGTRSWILGPRRAVLAWRVARPDREN